MRWVRLCWSRLANAVWATCKFLLNVTFCLQLLEWRMSCSERDSCSSMLVLVLELEFIQQQLRYPSFRLINDREFNLQQIRSSFFLFRKQLHAINMKWAFSVKSHQIAFLLLGGTPTSMHSIIKTKIDRSKHYGDLSYHRQISYPDLDHMNVCEKALPNYFPYSSRKGTALTENRRASQ